MSREYCNNCVHQFYSKVELGDSNILSYACKQKRYKKLIAKGKNPPSGLDDLGYIVYNKYHLSEFWSNKRICLRKNTFIINQLLPIIISVLSLGIAIIALLFDK